jgi:transcriptional regulator with XRE-family HTH domain
VPRKAAKRSANTIATQGSSRARVLFEKSGLSLEDLGQKMGYEGDTARKSAWQFLNKTADPRLSMLQKFADALGITMVDLVK